MHCSKPHFSPDTSYTAYDKGVWNSENSPVLLKITNVHSTAFLTRSVEGRCGLDAVPHFLLLSETVLMVGGRSNA